MLAPIHAINESQPYCKINLPPSHHTFVILDRNLKPTRAIQKGGKVLVMNGMYVICNHPNYFDELVAYRIVELYSGAAALVRTGLDALMNPSDLDEILKNPSTPRTTTTKCNLDTFPHALPAKINGKDISSFGHLWLAKNVKSIVFPEHMREVFIRQHDNCTAAHFDQNRHNWQISPIGMLDVGKGSPYMFQDDINGEYTAYFFADDAALLEQSLRSIVDRYKLSIDLVTDLDLTMTDYEGKYVIHIADAYVSSHLRVKKTQFEAQRRDITQWNNLIDEHFGEIKIIDAYQNLRAR